MGPAASQIAVRHGPLAQLAEQLTLNQLVPGSSPGGLTSNLTIAEFFAFGARRNASGSKELGEAEAKNFFT